MIDISQEKIMENWGVDNSDTPLLSIKCMTYNHEKYIAQCIEGFLIQKTSFPFEILIHDDCSTDRTESIVREYEVRFPNIIKGIYEIENQWEKKCNAHLKKIDAAIKGKYIAICEGDDYWTDPLKLQKQVDFLEMNPEYSMCFHSAKIINELGIADKLSGVVEEREYTANEVFKQWTAPTASLLFKREIYDLPMNDRYKPLYGDIILILKAAKCGKLKGMSDQMSVYRVHSGGVTYDKTRRKGFAKRLPEHFLYIRDNFGEMLDSKDVRLALAASLRGRLFHYPIRIFTSYDMFLALFYDPKYLFRKFLKCLQICFVMNLLVLEVL